MMVPVLMYHHINPHAGDTVTVTPEVFAAQMTFLRDEGYQTLSADELMDSIQGRVCSTAKKVAITFDDGWLDNYLYALPLLTEYRFKATFFLISGRVDAASKSGRVDGAEIPDHNTSKSLMLSGEAGAVVLDWNSVREMDANKLFRFYSHTVNHRKCADLSIDELESELVVSKGRLEAELGKECDYLCWPYGSFSSEGIRVAAKVGYQGAFTTIDGYCESGSDPFMVKRIEVKNSVQWLIDRLSEGRQ